MCSNVSSFSFRTDSGGDCAWTSVVTSRQISTQIMASQSRMAAWSMSMNDVVDLIGSNAGWLPPTLAAVCLQALEQAQDQVCCPECILGAICTGPASRCSASPQGAPQSPVQVCTLCQLHARYLRN